MEANERAFAAEVRVASAVYGPDFTADALALINDFRTSNDLDELITGLAAFRDAHPAEASARAVKATAEPADEPADSGLEGDIDLSEGEASRQRELAPARRSEGGVVNAIRGLFDQAGTASRPPRT